MDDATPVSDTQGEIIPLLHVPMGLSELSKDSVNKRRNSFSGNGQDQISRSTIFGPATPEETIP